MALSKWQTKTPDPVYNQKFHVIDNEVHERKIIHQFKMSDVEDPEIYVAEPICQWKETDKGIWATKHCKDMVFHIHQDALNWGHLVTITGMVTPKRWTEFCLKFS